MTIRGELETIGFGLAAGGVAFAGTMTALVTMVPLGFYPTATSLAGPLWAAILPAAFVAIFAWVLRRHARARLHPLPCSAAAFIGGLLSFALFHPLGLSSVLFLPALIVYPATLLAGFVLDRPDLTAGDVGLHSLTSLALYSVFAVPQLMVALRWIDLTGCDGCDTSEASAATILLFLMALTVVFGAAFRFRLPSDRRPRASLPAKSLR